MVGAHHGRCARALCGAAAAARLRRLVGRARRRLVAAHGTGGLVATGGARARDHRGQPRGLRDVAGRAAAVSDLFVALTPGNLLACFIGTVLGTIVGVLPGLGPAGAMALLLPLTIKLGPTAGLIMLAGIYYGAMYGGSTTSILVNVPGEAASVVTTIDGYRLARRGRAGAALAVAAIASFVAGTFSVVALQLAAPLVARAALAFGPAEYFAFALLGVVLLANLTGGSRAKSLAMVVLGLMLSTVGMDPLGGTVRFTFDLAGAQAGFSFIAVTAGLFGVAEVLTTMAEPGSTMPAAKVRFRELYPNREEIGRASCRERVYS